MSLYSNLKSTATRLLKAYGRSMMLGAPARAVIGMRVKTVVHAHTDSGVETGDIHFLLSADANPVRMERLNTGDESLIIVATDPIKPADTVLAWNVYGRAG